MLKKSLAIGIILLFISSGIIPVVISDNPISTKTIYVDDDNTDGPWDGSKEQPYQYIHDGIDNASEGDTIFVRIGNYNDNLVIQKPINLIGEKKNKTIITGNNINSIIRIKSDWITISNFTFIGNYNIHALKISSSYNRIQNNYFINCGIYIIEGSDTSIIDNIIEKGPSDLGIECSCSNHCTFYNNRIYKCGIGIYNSHCEYNLIKNNVIDCNDIENSYAISINFCEKIQIISNQVSHSQLGTIVSYSDEINVSYNTFKNNGIGFRYESSQCIINNNNFILNLIHASFDHLIRTFHHFVGPSLWIRNFWGIPHVLPKIIAGTINIEIFSGFVTVPIPFIEFDFLPRIQPNEMQEGLTI